MLVIFSGIYSKRNKIVVIFNYKTKDFIFEINIFKINDERYIFFENKKKTFALHFIAV
jgi:hypothetical protein